jgi:hypothetical protein
MDGPHDAAIVSKLARCDDILQSSNSAGRGKQYVCNVHEGSLGSLSELQRVHSSFILKDGLLSYAFTSFTADAAYI